MSCGCQFAYAEADEYAEAWREGRVQRSRKPHHCGECGDEIPVGSRYCFAVGIFDNRAVTYVRCVACSGLAELLAMKHEVCPLWGGLSDFCDEVGFDWFEWRDKLKEQP